MDHNFVAKGCCLKWGATVNFFPDILHFGLSVWRWQRASFCIVQICTGLFNHPMLKPSLLCYCSESQITSILLHVYWCMLHAKYFLHNSWQAMFNLGEVVFFCIFKFCELSSTTLLYLWNHLQQKKE